VRISIGKSTVQLFCAALTVLSGSVLYSETPARQILAGVKTTITGTILSRDGDLITVWEKKSGGLVRISLYEDTKIERRKGHWEFFRHPRMDVTAMVPGLKIEAEGVGNTNGQLDARKISFRPDVFGIEIAQAQLILANQAATESAQSTANRGVENASAAQVSAQEAQASAHRAQDLADQADAEAQTAGELAVLDAAAVQMINKRVSELDDYKTVAETSIYFDNGKAVLDDAAKRELDQLADIATSLDGYMIEIAGYASNPGSRKLNQKLSEERAAAVTQYLLEAKDVPMRRILAPAGYGATHLFASSDDPEDRPIDRRVDLKVLVNKALGVVH
jgi:outer membrane protein OmpA-like peptidoglycan-associated protein